MAEKRGRKAPHWNRDFLLAKAWRRFERRRDPDSRRELAEHYLPLLHRVAASLARRCGPLVSHPELLGAGTEGLLEAIDSFRPDRGATFVTHAGNRIRFRILDYLREIDHTTRRGRHNARLLDRLRGEAGAAEGPLSEDDLFRRSGLRPNHFREAMHVGRPLSLNVRVFAGHDCSAEEHGDVLPDERAEPPSQNAFDQRFWSAVFRGLNAEELDLLWGYYKGGKSMAQIGRELGLSESRVSQMHSDVIARLRRKHSPDELMQLLNAA